MAKAKKITKPARLNPSERTFVRADGSSRSGGKFAAYNPLKIEKKWQKAWEKSGYGKAKDFDKRKKYYVLVEFPFPSGDGLHVGHVRSYTALDAVSRKKRSEGLNVLYPMGWDAFGLPTENYAIKTGQHPTAVTKKNTDNFRRQMKSIGFSFDWGREVNTTDPKYYKWTQWIFLQMLKKGLAYKKKILISWCLSCKVGLANEEVIDGKCERCGSATEKREREQWMLAITKYADRLHDDLDAVDYLDKVKTQQRNWIGRSEGAEIEFRIKNLEYKMGAGKNAGVGADVDAGAGKSVKVFTTRPDTIFGVSYVVLAPEHPLIIELKPEIENWEQVARYTAEARSKTDMDRVAEGKEKTGVELHGVKVVNPANGHEVPVYVADYVLPHYGTGAVMAVPAHDKRDFEFAKKYNLTVKQVIVAKDAGYLVVEKSISKEATAKLSTFGKVVVEKTDADWGKFFRVTVAGEKEAEFISFLEQNLIVAENNPESKDDWYTDSMGTTNMVVFPGRHYQIVDHTTLESAKRYGIGRGIPKEQVDFELGCYEKDGVNINSEFLNGLSTEEAMRKISHWLTERGAGKKTITYKLRDWVFSRQRYWGEPIPVVYCEACGTVPVPDGQLPVVLPQVKNYTPTETGESPLAAIEKWVNTKCPSCGGNARRETDTMPNWAGSSWYYLRYVDSKNSKVFADKKKLKYWLAVDWYNGGMEHTTLHLLYSRFWHKFLYDIGAVPTKEPYKKRTSHGMILAANGEKMSKSRGNVINPDAIVKTLGADTLRIYEMFIGPFDQAISWNMDAVAGSRRFLERVWGFSQRVSAKTTTKNKELLTLTHKTIKKVSGDIEEMKFNTVISQLMIFLNAIDKEEVIAGDSYATLLKLLSPFAPHLTEELWSNILGKKKSVHAEPWPKPLAKYLKEDKVKIAIQIQGKMRDVIEIEAGATEAEVKKIALARPNVVKWLTNCEIKKSIYIKDKVLNIVI